MTNVESSSIGGIHIKSYIRAILFASPEERKTLPLL